MDLYHVSAATNGTGISAMIASRQFTKNITNVAATIISTLRAKSTLPKTMKSHKRSVSLVTRVMRLPTRCLPK